MRVAFEYLPKEFVSKTGFYDYKTPMVSVLGKLGEYGTVVVTKDGDYYGIVDSRAMARKGGANLSRSIAISKFSFKAPLLDKETSIEKAMAYFYTSGSKALPYYEKRIIGIVKRDAILKAILSMHLLSKYTAWDMMVSPVISIDSEATVAEAQAVMKQKRINRLLVTGSGKPSGIVTHKDIFGAYARLNTRPSKLEGHVSSARSIGELAETNLYGVDYKENGEHVIREIIERGVSSLVVRRSGNVVGIVTVHDIFKAGAEKEAGDGTEITVSGLDSYTKEYEEDIRSELKSLEAKINRFHRIRLSSMSLNVKRPKGRNYELKMRIFLERRGSVSAYADGYSLQKVLSDVASKAYSEIKRRKESLYSGRARERLDEE